MFSLTFFKIRQCFSFCSRRCKKPRALRQPKEFEEKVKRQFSRQEKIAKKILKRNPNLYQEKIAISKVWIFYFFFKIPEKNSDRFFSMFRIFDSVLKISVSFLVNGKMCVSCVIIKKMSRNIE